MVQGSSWTHLLALLLLEKLLVKMVCVSVVHLICVKEYSPTFVPLSVSISHIQGEVLISLASSPLNLKE
jgi:hypothetical protein